MNPTDKKRAKKVPLKKGGTKNNTIIIKKGDMKKYNELVFIISYKNKL